MGCSTRRCSCRTLRLPTLPLALTAERQYRWADATRDALANPRLFISYSWTNADHEARVLRLATELMQSGVHVLRESLALTPSHRALGPSGGDQRRTDQSAKAAVAYLHPCAHQSPRWA